MSANIQLQPSNRSSWWSPRLGAPGERVEDIDDINQCLAILFATPKGADPHRPDFGCDLHSLIDLPIAQAAGHLGAAMIQAASLWEPRIIVQSVPTEIDGAHIRYTVIWYLQAAGFDTQRHNYTSSLTVRDTV